MFNSGRDDLQIFDLTVRANNIKQGHQSLEEYYGQLVIIWKEIDRRRPNPMRDPIDKNTHNKLVQEDRLYQFLGGINEEYDKDRKDLLNQEPLPTVDQAYATIRREIARKKIMVTEHLPNQAIGGLIAKKGGGKPPHRKEDKNLLKCTHCGGSRHTKEGCFKIIGYPEWWSEKKKPSSSTSHAHATVEGGHAHATVEGGYKIPENTKGMASMTQIIPSSSMRGNEEVISDHSPQVFPYFYFPLFNSSEISNSRNIGGDNNGSVKQFFLNTSKMGAQLPDWSKMEGVKREATLIGKASLSFFRRGNKWERVGGLLIDQPKSPTETNTQHWAGSLWNIVKPKTNKPTFNLKLTQNLHYQSNNPHRPNTTRPNIQHNNGPDPPTTRPDPHRPNISIDTTHRTFVQPQPTIIACTSLHYTNGLSTKSSILLPSGNKTTTWIFDCGATDTMSYDPNDFHTITPVKNRHVQTANGNSTKIVGIGTITLSPSITLHNCLFVPNLSHKLLSVSHLTKSLPCTVLMHPTHCIIQDIRTWMTLGLGIERGGLYYVDNGPSSGPTALSSEAVDRQIRVWHQRLGHPSPTCKDTINQEKARAQYQ